MKIDVKSLVKDRTVQFVFYREGNLYYEIVESGFMFPVPIEDIGNATFKATDKAILFMRYIRKYAKEIENNSLLMSELGATLPDFK